MTLYVNTEKKVVFQRWLGTHPKIDKLLEDNDYRPLTRIRGGLHPITHDILNGFKITYLYKKDVQKIIKQLQRGKTEN